MYLIVYHISDNNTRTKTADRLLEWGFERIQYSVFIGTENPAEIKELWDTLKHYLQTENNPEDKLFAIAIDKQHFKNMKIIGNNTLDMDYLMGETDTLII